MADFLPDEIVRNILARLPAKPLLRFRCLSKYWNCVLREPYFINLRSRRTIILPLRETFHLIDDNVPVDDSHHSILKRYYPLKHLRGHTNIIVKVIGTFNGIVLLSYLQTMILYNPFTGASKKLPHLPCPCNRGGYGFGYGANQDDLKIIRFRQHYNICDVYSFKKSSWSTSQYNVKSFKFEDSVGKFLNGFLHWIAYDKDVLSVLNVTDMELSEIRLPFKREFDRTLLGTIDGCLCLLNQISNIKFHMWVMKEYGVENSWLKYSFSLALEDTSNNSYFPLCILDSGRILMLNPLEQLIIYEISKDSYKTLNLTLCNESYWKMNGVEYVESMVSPSEICS